MAEYGRFADVYDLFMQEIPYEKWCAYICDLLKEDGIEDGLVLDLGCGTGIMTELLAKRGYDMTGVDASPEMLSHAAEKQAESGLPILYLNQDMREFELYGTMRAIVSVCDTMNYLTEPEDFLTVLKLVNNYLDPGGLFIFDLKSEHFYRDILGSGTWASNEEDASYIWENDYDPEDQTNEYAVTVFEKTNGDLYSKFEEYHLQRAYRIAEVRRLAEEAGMETVGIYNECTRDDADEMSERLHVVLREKGKKVSK